MKLLRAEFLVPIADKDRIKLKELGGGGCIDIGVYLISLACMVFNELPETITAVGNLMSTGKCFKGHKHCAMFNPFKVSKRAKIRNRYNQAPHLTQDTNGSVNVTVRHHKREPRGQPFPSR